MRKRPNTTRSIEETYFFPIHFPMLLLYKIPISIFTRKNKYHLINAKNIDFFKEITSRTTMQLGKRNLQPLSSFTFINFSLSFLQRSFHQFFNLYFFISSHQMIYFISYFSLSSFYNIIYFISYFSLYFAISL